jgi:predicted anti-sigma-YlaC factor YlaD
MHIREEDLKLYALRRSQPDQTPSIESHLAECEHCRNKLTQVELFAKQLAELGRLQGSEGQTDRRREPRFEVDAPASMQVLNPLSTNRVDVRILNLSKRGLRLSVTEFLQKGTIVQVLTKGSSMLGEVCHCSRVGTEFQVGILITEVFPNP